MSKKDGKYAPKRNPDGTFVKGGSGNPKGRKLAKETISSWLKLGLDETIWLPVPDSEEKFAIKRGEFLANRILQLATYSKTSLPNIEGEWQEVDINTKAWMDWLKFLLPYMDPAQLRMKIEHDLPTEIILQADGNVEEIYD